MVDHTCEPGWDDAATLLRAEPLVLADDDEATCLRSAPARPLPELHRTPEEAEDTASAELPPLRLDDAEWGAR